MMYRQIECPTCGNTTTAKSVDEPQKCTWCRRLFKVTITQRNKDGKKKKLDWSVEPVDFPDDNVPQTTRRPRIKSLDEYRYEDIYGKHKR